MPKPKNAKCGGNLANEVYDGAATIGKAAAVVGLIIASLIAVIMIIISISIIRAPPDTRTTAATGTIKSVACRTDQNGKICSFNIDYTVDVKTYTLFATSSTDYAIGNTIGILYDPAHPENARLAADAGNLKIFGWIILAVATVIVAFAIGNWWLTTKSKAYAAIDGVGAVARAVGNVVDLK